jgi:chemotaxis protein MotA
MSRAAPGIKPLSTSSKLDFSTILGLTIALGGILGGLVLEGGKISDIRQITAAMIVLGGTTGAVMVTTPLPLFLAAVKKLPSLVWDSAVSTTSVIELILALSMRARRKGIISLDDELDSIPDPFLKKAIMLAVDGTDGQDIRKIMELELGLMEQRGEAEARVFEAAGGYAPTVGIIGAVLGLIQVMKHLADIERVGHGIAVAFVATVYGVAIANLFLLPAASKLKLRLHQKLQIKEIMLEGALSIAAGMNPTLIQSKLEAYAQDEPQDALAGTKNRANSAPAARMAAVR